MFIPPYMGYVLLVSEWEHNCNVTVEDPDELGDEVEVQGEVDHRENERT